MIIRTFFELQQQDCNEGKFSADEHETPGTSHERVRQTNIHHLHRSGPRVDTEQAYPATSFVH